MNWCVYEHKVHVLHGNAWWCMKISWTKGKVYEIFMNNKFMKKCIWIFMNIHELMCLWAQSSWTWMLFIKFSWIAHEERWWIVHEHALVHDQPTKSLMNRAWTAHAFTWTFMNEPWKFMTSWTNFGRGMYISVFTDCKKQSISKEINCAEHEYMNMPLPNYRASATPELKRAMVDMVDMVYMAIGCRNICRGHPLKRAPTMTGCIYISCFWTPQFCSFYIVC